MKCLLGMLDILFREVNMKNRRSCRRSKQNTHMHQQETNAVGQLISREKVERLGEKGRKRRGGEGRVMDNSKMWKTMILRKKTENQQ